MRQRITFLHKPEHGVDPATIKVTDNSLTGPVVPALREDRLTLALDELPDELRQVLQTCHELHIRWVSPYAYDTISPLFSRLSPGFHLFYTPAQDSHSLEYVMSSFLVNDANPQHFSVMDNSVLPCKRLSDR